MPVSLTVVKRLFAKSGNQCAIPWCHAPLVVEDHSIAEICHIRARRKGGPRYDPVLTAASYALFAVPYVLVAGWAGRLADQHCAGRGKREGYQAAHDRGVHRRVDRGLRW